MEILWLPVYKSFQLHTARLHGVLLQVLKSTGKLSFECDCNMYHLSGSITLAGTFSLINRIWRRQISTVTRIWTWSQRCHSCSPAGVGLPAYPLSLIFFISMGIIIGFLNDCCEISCLGHGDYLINIISLYIFYTA